MNNLITFASKEFGKLRTIEIDSTTYFVGKDVAEALGYANINKAIQAHVDDEDKITLDFKGYSQNGKSLWMANDFSNKIVINESGVFSLILSSKLPRAKEYKRWVTSEVLPAIHRQGCYYNPSEKPCDAVIMTITPEMAAKMLENNVGNRKLNAAAVKKLAEDMRMGKFALNGTSLKFYKDGTLADGQHRCAACVKAGVPFTTYVINGLDKDVLPTIDCGRSRSLVDSLNMTGCTIHKKLVPAMNTYFSKGLKLTASQAQVLWNDYEDKFTILCDVLAGKHHDHILSQSSVRAYLIHLAISENWNEKDLRSFVTGLKDKPNRDNNYELSCYNFRNFYDRRVRNKINDNKSLGDKTKTAVVIDALCSLTESYKSDSVIKQFQFRNRAKNVLNTGYMLAQDKFALIETQNHNCIEAK